MGLDGPIDLLPLQTSTVYRTIKMGSFFLSSSETKRTIVSIGDFGLARSASLSFFLSLG
jgi:hypothetical protein